MSTDRLAVSDLDGTLTRSVAVDAECFLRAFREELGVELDADWAAYADTTDEGIAREGLRRAGRKGSLDDEIAAARVRFVEILGRELAASPASCRPLPGALELLEHLRQTGWSIAIATGAWRASAELKRACAGLPDWVPIFASDERPSREEIVQAAIGEHRGYVVGLGDGVWDVRTFRRLALPFVGVGSGARARRLRAAGAARVVADLRHPARMTAWLETAPVPGGDG